MLVSCFEKICVKGETDGIRKLIQIKELSINPDLFEELYYLSLSLNGFEITPGPLRVICKIIGLDPIYGDQLNTILMATRHLLKVRVINKDMSEDDPALWQKISEEGRQAIDQALKFTHDENADFKNCTVIEKLTAIYKNTPEYFIKHGEAAQEQFRSSIKLITLMFTQNSERLPGLTKSDV